MAERILAIEEGGGADRARLAEEADRRGWRVVSGGGPSVVLVRLDGSPRRSRAERRIGAGACGFVSFPDRTPISAALDGLYDRMLDEGWIVGGGRLGGDAFLLTAERGVHPIPGGDWAGPLLDLLETRAGAVFHKTRMESDRLPERMLPIAEASAALAERWARLGLFPGYSRGGALYPGAEFGFVAARAEEGCVVTSRGGSKSAGGADGFSWLRAIDADGTLRVSGAAADLVEKKSERIGAAAIFRIPAPGQR